MSLSSAAWQRLMSLGRHPVLRNTLWLYVVTIGGYALPLLTLPYLARVLSLEVFGLVAYAQSLVWNCITLTDYGFNLTATREVAMYRDNTERLSRLLSAVITAKALLTGLGFLLYAGVVLWMDNTRAHWPLFLVSFLSVLGYWLFPLWLYQGLENMKQIAVRDFLAKLLGLIALFTLVHGDQDALWAAAAPALSLFLSGFTGLLRATRLTGVAWRKPSWPEVLAQLTKAWPPFVNQIASTICYSAGVFYLGWRGANAEIALFNAAMRLANVPRNLISPLTTSLYAHLSHRSGGEELPNLHFVRRHSLLLSLPFLGIGLVLALTADWTLPLVLGEKFSAAATPFKILVLGIYPFALSHVYTTYYMLPSGLEKQWSLLSLRNLPLGAGLAVLSLAFQNGSVALASLVVGLDVISAAAFWHFYRKRSQALGLG